MHILQSCKLEILALMHFTELPVFMIYSFLIQMYIDILIRPKITFDLWNSIFCFYYPAFLQLKKCMEFTSLP